MEPFNDGLAIAYSSNNGKTVNINFIYDDSTPDYETKYNSRLTSKRHNPTTYLSSPMKYNSTTSSCVISRFVKEYDELFFSRASLTYSGDVDHNKTYYYNINESTEKSLRDFYYSSIKHQYDGESDLNAFSEYGDRLAYRGYPLDSFYDLSNGVITTPIEFFNGNTRMNYIEINNLDISFFKDNDLVNVDIIVTSKAKGSGATIRSSGWTRGLRQDVNIDLANGIINLHYNLSASDTEKTYEIGDDITYTITVQIKYKNSNVFLDGQKFEVTYTPVFPQSSDAGFYTLPGTDVPVTGNYYGVTNGVSMRYNAVALGNSNSKKRWMTDSERLHYGSDQVVAGGFGVGHDYYTIGKKYRVRTLITTPWSNKIYFSPFITMYSFLNSYNIKDVSCNVIGQDAASTQVDSILYTGSDAELSNNIDIRPVYSDGDVLVEAKFRLYVNPTVNYKDNSLPPIPVESETRPTDIYLVCIQANSDLYDKLYNRVTPLDQRQTFRDNSNIKRYPNVNYKFGQRVIAGLPDDEDVLADGVIFHHEEWTKYPLVNGQQYTMYCPITENNTYAILLVLGIKEDGFNTTYTTYELSNMPNSSQNFTQFDVAIKES